MRAAALAVVAIGLITSGSIAFRSFAQQPAATPRLQRLPEESQLPGQQPVPRGGEKNIPAETVLPGEEPQSAAATALPDEAVLPGAAQAGADQAADQVGATESSLSPGTLRPWLRLRFGGHTGAIRTLAISDDGKVMVSAGEDKDLHVWVRQPQAERKPSAERQPEAADEAAQRRAWFHRRTIRWPIERGARGRIYTVAMHGNWIALGGQSASGAQGDVWLVDLSSGELIRPLIDVNEGHRDVVVSAVWQPIAAQPQTAAAEAEPAVEEEVPSAPEPAAQPIVYPALATADVTGRVLIWTADAATGIWSAQSVVAPDRVTYGEEAGAALGPLRRFLPLAFLSADVLLMPRYVGQAAEPVGTHLWHLQRYRLSTGQSDLLPVPHHSMITAMRSTADGSLLVSGDETGRLLITSFLGGPDQPVLHVAEEQNGVVLSLDIDAAGQRLLVGRSLHAGGRLSGVAQWYDISGILADPAPGGAGAARVLATLDKPVNVWGAVIDAAHGEIALAIENWIEVFALGEDGSLSPNPIQTLSAAIGPVASVAFSSDAATPYQIAITQVGPETGDAADAPLTHAFDLSAVQLLRAAEVDPAQYRDGAAASGDWSVQLDESAEEPEPTLYLYQGQQRRGRLPLMPHRHGSATAIAWMDESVTEDDDDPQRTPRKVAIVGTSGHNNIYVFEATDNDEARLLRQYRDHSGSVVSLSTSADGRYLVSGSVDATVGVWNLADLFSASELENRWGATFEIRDGQLFADEVRLDGPLFFRGVRSGDRLVSLKWVDGTEMRAASGGEELLAALQEVSFDTLLVFEFSRLGVPREAFQSYPAWQPLARLFVDRSREWAMWTPAGFYDASFNGHELFGWQINRGVTQLPEYFRAAQFRERLERPAVIRQLLAAGSLDAAMRQSVSGLAPPAGEGAIVNQFLNKPVIRLIRPRDGEIVTDGETIVEADILFPRGAVLAPPKVFAGGVPAAHREQVEVAQEDDGHRHRYRWKVRLPSDRRVPLEVLAATDSQAIGRARIELANRTPAPSRAARMHFLAIGISDYADPQIQQLDFAARGAGLLAELFARQTQGLYRTTISQLTDRDGIGALWREYAAQAARELAADVAPDDLVVMYLCGHGLRDRRTNRWYFVTADARYNDLMNDRYDDLLSFDDLAALAELPCRKLAIIDSCHSGAVQPALREDDLKAALRFLQGDVVLTLTASEGEEEAAEQKDRQLGRFTAHLVDALHGHADENGDGTVSLDEVIRYVTAAVGQDSRTLGFIQHPTAGPAHWLDTIQLPLTRATKQ